MFRSSGEKGYIDLARFGVAVILLFPFALAFHKMTLPTPQIHISLFTIGVFAFSNSARAIFVGLLTGIFEILLSGNFIFSLILLFISFIFSITHRKPDYKGVVFISFALTMIGGITELFPDLLTLKNTAKLLFVSAQTSLLSLLVFSVVQVVPRKRKIEI